MDERFEKTLDARPLPQQRRSFQIWKPRRCCRKSLAFRVLSISGLKGLWMQDLCRSNAEAFGSKSLGIAENGYGWATQGRLWQWRLWATLNTLRKTICFLPGPAPTHGWYTIQSDAPINYFKYLLRRSQKTFLLFCHQHRISRSTTLPELTYKLLQQQSKHQDTYRFLKRQKHCNTNWYRKENKTLWTEAFIDTTSGSIESFANYQNTYNTSNNPADAGFLKKTTTSTSTSTIAAPPAPANSMLKYMIMGDRCC